MKRSLEKLSSGFARGGALYYLAHLVLILLGALLLVPDGDVWSAIGTSLIATGGAGVVLYLYVQRADETRDAMRVVSDAGIRRVHRQRAAQIRDEYALRLGNAGQQIDILGFGLSDFRRDYIEQLGELAASAQVRILLLSPGSQYADQRDREEGQSPGTIRSQVKEFIAQYAERYEMGVNTNPELRTYDALPMVNIFRIDDDIFWGPYLLGTASANTMTIRVRRGGYMFTQLSDHFEKVWTSHAKALDEPPKDSR